MTETNNGVELNLLCDTIRESKRLMDEQKAKLMQFFGHRFITAYSALREKKVKKYVFYPSQRIVWIVTGKERDYQILPLANFCSCFDFYFRVVSQETSVCYHLLAQKLSEALQMYVVIKKSDADFIFLIKTWGKIIERKRELSIRGVENVRRIVSVILQEEKEVSTQRLLNEINDAGFNLTTRHLINILIADKTKRFKHSRELWSL